VRPIEFELERTIRAPIDQVFARLVDIEGHNAWMADTGSMLKHTRKTSPGEPSVGTTFIDETKQGTMPGEIAELEAPHTVVYHWWEKSKSGKLKFEGWPSYHLQHAGDSETLVRHRGQLMAYWTGAASIERPPSCATDGVARGRADGAPERTYFDRKKSRREVLD